MNDFASDALPKKHFQLGLNRFAHIDTCAIFGRHHYDRMPFAARILAENLLRNGIDQASVERTLVQRIARPGTVELSLKMARLILPDSSGIPVLMDLAALRSALARHGRSVDSVKSHVPISLVIDHSLQVDVAGKAGAVAENLAHEYRRNDERYRFLKWAQQAFDGLDIHPPGSGIIHQIHLERIADVARVETGTDFSLVYPDSVVGGDSHTPMVNALGVLGWGVGGLEAEMVALGEPYPLPNPEFVGVEFQGSPAEGISTTDIALTITHRLRQEGVVGAFVEFFGDSATRMSVPDRATLANMAPEYGATTGFWPVDEQTLAYLKMTGRTPEKIELIRAHAQSAGLFRQSDMKIPDYDRVISIDLAQVRRSLAGPSKPHRLLETSRLADAFKSKLSRPVEAKQTAGIADGAIAIAAITSCTNTANPAAMITAGLVARNALAMGLRPPAFVKTSLAPGSRAVTAYLERAGLLNALEALGFHLVGYGCTTCGGKSGPLHPDALAAIKDSRAMVAILSGNRNFDGRIHRLVSASFLASPALVVAYAIAGNVLRDLDIEPIGEKEGREIFLRDLWPDAQEVDQIMSHALTAEMFANARLDDHAMEKWQQIDAPSGSVFSWNPNSSYIVEPPFFDEHNKNFEHSDRIEGARVLGMFEDGLTTDHISPGGEIPPESPAGLYLQDMGIVPAQFNTYVGRRGNHHVMARGTYANLRIRNLLVPEREGWWTRHFPDGDIVSIFDAADAYRRDKVPLIILAGQDFGAGSSRDWAAKGPALLGVSAVIARSFERIHRSNLIGLGILPLCFTSDETIQSLRLRGDETFLLSGLHAAVEAQAEIEVIARSKDHEDKTFRVRVDVRTKSEIVLLQNGGVFKSALLQRLGADREI